MVRGEPQQATHVDEEDKANSVAHDKEFDDETESKREAEVIDGSAAEEVTDGQLSDNAPNVLIGNVFSESEEVTITEGSERGDSNVSLDEFTSNQLTDTVDETAGGCEAAESGHPSESSAAAFNDDIENGYGFVDSEPQSIRQPPVHFTKAVFNETQKIAYVGLCSVTSLELVHNYKLAVESMVMMSTMNWQRNLMKALYRHMELTQQEQKMIESLSQHNILPTDLVRNFTSEGTTTEVPVEAIHHNQTPSAKPSTDKCEDAEVTIQPMMDDHISELREALPNSEAEPETMLVTEESQEGTVGPATAGTIDTNPSPEELHRPTTKTKPQEQTLSTRNGDPLIIDLRWTVICDLFLLCLGNAQYDSRSRVFLFQIARYLGLNKKDVVAFEKRMTNQLLTTESPQSAASDQGSNHTVENWADEQIIGFRSEKERNARNKEGRKKRLLMVGLATIGGGLVLGLSAGLMAPVIGAGIGAIFTTVGVTGTSAFLGGTGGIALITTGATLTGGRIAAKKMGNRTKGVSIFEIITYKETKRVSAVVSVSGWLALPTYEEAVYAFMNIDESLGDHMSLFWEPELLTELGSAFKIIATEVLTQAIQQALGHTMMGMLLAGLAWPMALTKIGYLIDNPWANALDRARVAGLILADTLMNRNLGARPIILVGYSLGSRVIFYALLELARLNAFGIVQDVFIFGTPVSATNKEWRECATAVSGRFVNGYARNDWMLGFLFRASTGGLGRVAGLRPLSKVERIENFDCTEYVTGHLTYRAAMPKMLKLVGVEVTSEELPDLYPDDDKPASDAKVDPEAECSNQAGSRMSLANLIRRRHRATTSSMEQYDPESDPRVMELSSRSVPEVDVPVRMPDVPVSNRPTHWFSFGRNRQSSTASSLNSNTEVSETEDRAVDTAPSQPASGLEMNKGRTTATTASTTCNSPESTSSPLSLTSRRSFFGAFTSNGHASPPRSPSVQSSLSSGNASIILPTKKPPPEPEPSEITSSHSMPAIHQPQDTTSTESSPDMSASQPALISNTFFFSNPFYRPLKAQSAEAVNIERSKKEVELAGFQVREIKTTLGKMVIPNEVTNPVPQVTLERPNFAKTTGYPGHLETTTRLKNDQQYKDFQRALRPLLLSKENQICLEFSFWATSPPQETKGIYELRTYVLKPGNLLEWETEWRKGLEYRRRYCEPVGAWFSQLGKLNTVHHMWTYPDLQTRKVTREEAWQEDGWAETVYKTVRLIDNMHTAILVPLEFSPLR
ncbi:hypothetical protein BZG36_04677 [Bifiguratus adelaidae]|uniref:NIPSNAP domain-containing protein n=1 Tax=Bifiguratus adelaidae TaxID=1938954 RepID=A0A261XXB1_9FUNG|nr:hypothetical protein BZG36_04677 [Bifiguratus adelaidae]